MVSSSPRMVLLVVVIVVIIVSGSVLGFQFLKESPSNISSSSSSVTTSVSSSTSTATSSSSSSSTQSSYSLELVQAGSGPVASSPMTTYMGITSIPYDGPCCTDPVVYGGEIYYNDGPNQWGIQGDIEPGIAWASANTSGLTITYQTYDGGPHHEFWGDHESFDDSSLYADLQTSVNATVFSVEAYIPYYSYYAGCQQDTGNGGPGCTYEVTPYNSASLALIANGNWVTVSFAEVCNNPCTSNGLQMSAFLSAGGDSCVAPCPFNQTTLPTYTPLHKLTIATDRKTFLDFYVDNTLVYSANSTLASSLAGSGLGIELAQRTSVNNETDTVTWSNFTAYASSTIEASGLPSGSMLFVNGPAASSFTISQVADSSGNAIVNVSPDPTNLTVSVQLGDQVIASYSIPVDAGASFNLVKTS